MARLVSSKRVRCVFCVWDILSELEGRVVTGVVGRASVAVSLSVVARIISRRRVCVASRGYCDYSCCHWVARKLNATIRVKRRACVLAAYKVIAAVSTTGRHRGNLDSDLCSREKLAPAPRAQ